MKEMKLRVGEGKLLKQLAMQIFNGDGTLAPPRALRPPLLRDHFDGLGEAMRISRIAYTALHLYSSLE